MQRKYDLCRLLTIPALAAKLNVSVRTVRSWVYRRSVPFTRLQRRIYFDAGVLEGILSANAVEPFKPHQVPVGQGGEREEVTR
jgi:hypothetical protein